MFYHPCFVILIYQFQQIFSLSIYFVNYYMKFFLKIIIQMQFYVYFLKKLDNFATIANQARSLLLLGLFFFFFFFKIVDTGFRPKLTRNIYWDIPSQCLTTIFV